MVQQELKKGENINRAARSIIDISPASLAKLQIYLVSLEKDSDVAKISHSFALYRKCILNIRFSYNFFNLITS